MVLAGACTDEAPSVDASVPVDASASSDLGVFSDGGGLLHGAFTIIGCAVIDSTRDPIRCSGPAPLALTFVPVGQGVSTFVWSFPGGNPADARTVSPSTSYVTPGSYQVMLAAGGTAGTITANAVIQVTAGEVGASCGLDRECDSAMSLGCVCKPSDGCAAGLGAGLCSRGCQGGGCGIQARCVDLTPPSGVDGGSAPEPADVDGGTDGGSLLVISDPLAGPWREALCLPICTTDTDCRAGLSCRELPSLASGQSAGGTFTWQRGCFANLLGEVGAACVDAYRTTRNERCLSRRCDHFGARGLCTAACATDADCPSYAACATFAGSPGSVCLAKCDSTHACTDPLLACESPGAPGAQGFTVAAAVAATYCAPKRCTKTSDCAPAGTCTDSHCL